MITIDNTILCHLSGGVHPSFSHASTEPQAGAKEEILIGFLRAAGAFLFKVIADIFTKKSEPKKDSEKGFHSAIF